jgi:hypothetical protein
MSLKSLDASNQGLDELAATIRTEHQAVGLAARNMLEHALRAGDALQAAKRQVAEGGWESWVRKHCDLSLRCAQVYMQLAAARSQIEAQAQHAAPHSLRAALKLIGPAPETSSRLHNTTNKTKPATSFDALAWWSGESIEGRRHFLDDVGSDPLLKAVPPTWGEDWALGKVSPLQLVKALEHKLAGNKSACKALAALRKTLQPPTIDLKVIATSDPLEFPANLRREPPRLATAGNGADPAS